MFSFFRKVFISSSTFRKLYLQTILVVKTFIFSLVWIFRLFHKLFDLRFNTLKVILSRLYLLWKLSIFVVWEYLAFYIGCLICNSTLKKLYLPDNKCYQNFWGLRPFSFLHMFDLYFNKQNKVAQSRLEQNKVAQSRLGLP